jgi:hypothetical protein
VNSKSSQMGTCGGPEGVMAGERITLAPLAGRGKGEGQRRIVEIDGATHFTDTELLPPMRNCATTSDAPLTNEDVYRNRDGVLATILAKLAGLPLILAFSPQAGRRDERAPLRQILQAAPRIPVRPATMTGLQGAAAKGLGPQLSL